MYTALLPIVLFLTLVLQTASRPIVYQCVPVETSVDYFDPRPNGGAMLDNAGDGYGEPLNVIVSGMSSPEVLTEDGIVNFARAIGFSEECFGLHAGAPQTANLGDGNGWVNQTIELRQDYDNAGVGTCLETLIGGNHFRVWKQNGSLADSGALFLAVSKEEPLLEHHTIIPDGYNIGRDLLVQNAVGQTSYNGVTYSTVARNITGLLAPGAVGVNHNISTDGIVTLLTVTIL
ncbi:hypothetical protein GLOTRDRAFT_99486 [Gloeophyllum trabeum ATCC 11539]|uniref:Uncharacterized protein n=1 Tax=Gloeophyllum trabeum (strain ATCC 11539 / FP-39264 / Madison 617) TaxID=670483 RepID=S7QCR2_GLOTA|nr:uncharacterized protein GLOTRDRAFT_99486 [Gloeophyllum trabeum ATCC 11539]EPQ57666.1 hypothetical protein GLOTRDRAFT_99486 [Gloeophyllum trabeum ATCC 11539]